MNTVQNRSDEVERNSEEAPLDGVQYVHNEAIKAMLREVYGYVVEANRLAVLRADKDAPPSCQGAPSPGEADA